MKPYCVVASFATADSDVWQSFSIFLEAGSRDEARQRGWERITARLSPVTICGGEVVVYDHEQIKILRQFRIFPPTEANVDTL